MDRKIETGLIEARGGMTLLLHRIKMQPQVQRIQRAQHLRLERGQADVMVVLPGGDVEFGQRLRAVDGLGALGRKLVK